MLKKIIIFIVLIVNGFISNAQNKFYRKVHKADTLYVKWFHISDGLIEIEVTINGDKTLFRHPSADVDCQIRLATKPKPQIKVFHITGQRRELLPLEVPAAIPRLSDGSCILLISDSMYATRKKDFFQLKFDISKNCNLSNSMLVKTRLYWSEDSWANPTKDLLLSEQDLPFGENLISGKYSMDKLVKNGFLFLQIVDEKGNSLFVSEAIFAKTIQ